VLALQQRQASALLQHQAFALLQHQAFALLQHQAFALLQHQAFALLQHQGLVLCTRQRHSEFPRKQLHHSSVRRHFAIMRGIVVELQLCLAGNLLASPSLMFEVFLLFIERERK
jgi:hypothetical protein